MKLENVTAVIRPRGKWESIDLGVALVQRCFKIIFLAWAVTVLPLILLFVLGGYAWYSWKDAHFESDTPWLFCVANVALPYFLIWWFKPFYERIPLYILSRYLFGEKVSVREAVKLWPRMLFSNWWQLLVVRRFSPNRSFIAPISELEKLKGTAFGQRKSLLLRYGGGGASSLTWTSWLVEKILLLSFVAAYAMIMGYGLGTELIEEHSEYFFYALFGIVWM